MCSQHTSFVSAANLSQVHVWFSNFFDMCSSVRHRKDWTCDTVRTGELLAWEYEDVLTVALVQWSSPNVQQCICVTCMR